MKLLGIFLRFPLGLFLAGLALQLPARAGGSAECTTGVDRYGPEAIRNFALALNDELDARKVNVAIVARSGWLRAKMPGGINYTHVAFIVFEPVVARDGTAFHTYTVYNLYQGPKGDEMHSWLKQDFTYDFVAGIAEPDVAVCVPTELLQRRILAVIRSPAYTGLWRPDYNLVANPWVDRFDNCVTHALKICVAAIYQTHDRVASLRTSGFISNRRQCGSGFSSQSDLRLCRRCGGRTLNRLAGCKPPPMIRSRHFWRLTGLSGNRLPFG